MLQSVALSPPFAIWRGLPAMTAVPMSVLWNEQQHRLRRAVLSRFEPVTWSYRGRLVATTFTVSAQVTDNKPLAIKTLPLRYRLEQAMRRPAPPLPRPRPARSINRRRIWQRPRRAGVKGCFREEVGPGGCPQGVFAFCLRLIEINDLAPGPCSAQSAAQSKGERTSISGKETWPGFQPSARAAALQCCGARLPASLAPKLHRDRCCRALCDPGDMHSLSQQTPHTDAGPPTGRTFR